MLVLTLVCSALPALAQRARVAVSAELSVKSVQPGGEAVIAVVLDIAKGFHSQSHTPKDPNLIPLTLKLDPVEGVAFGEVQYPPGEDETYPGLGAVNVYTGKVVVYVPVKVATDAKPGPLKLAGSVRYQVCDDKTCFAPTRTAWSVQTTVAAGAPEVNAPDLFKGYKKATTAPTTKALPTRGGGDGGSRGSPPPPGVANPQAAVPPAPAGAGGGGPGAGGIAGTTVVNDRPQWGVPVALGAAFVAGILFNIVPCVLPVLPIKVMGFAEVAQHDRAKTIVLSSVFGAGIVAVFGVLALFILVLDKFTWGQQFSNPWFAWGIVVLLAVMAAWMFGLLNFNLPGGVYGISPRHDTLIGNFEWGILTAVLSTPCTGPLFPPLMLWAQAQPVAMGVTAVMMVGVGMAFPYVVLSAFPEVARRFPRVGPWAELFKQMMGFLLLGAAVFFAAGRFVTGATLYWTLVPVAVIAALYLMARTMQYGAGPRGLTISALTALLLVGATTWWAATFVSPVKWEPYADATVDAARERGGVVLVKFTANWCLNCQYIERTVFHDKAAAAALARHGVVAVKADLTAEDAPGWGRLKQLSETGGIPLTAIYVPGEPKPIVLDSVYTAGTLIKTLDRAVTRKVAAAD
jgi:thiol:disulfide interchange protein DsbD